jgi:SNF2 family DNA or RNA helicase
MNLFGCVQALMFKAEYVFLMNGTPLTKSPADVFHIIHLLNPNVYVSKKNFMRYHAVYSKDDSGFPVIRSWKNLSMLDKLLKQYSRRLIKEDVLDLPPKQLVVKQFDLGPKHHKRLKELWDYGFLELQEDNIFLEGMALMMRVRQAMMDPSLLDLSEQSVYFEVLTNLLDELGDEQVIIFAHFQNTIDLIRKALKDYTIVELHGKVTKKELAVQKFKNKEAQILLANPLSAGVGLDFQQCHNVVFFELDYAVDSFWQGIDRTHRPGQVENVTVYTFVARNTPAVALLRSIKTNINYVEEVLKGREDSSTLWDNKISVKEETQWKKL